MDGQVTLRPVIEDDLSWLAGLRNDPTATGPHEWHGWSDPQRERRRWAESGLLGDNGGMLIVLHGTDRVGTVSWRKVQTGPIASNWAIGVGLTPEFRQCHLAYFDHAAVLMFCLVRMGLASWMVAGASWRIPCWPGFLTG